MKKILIASTALVSTAGLAAADVALSGRAEMGIYQYNAAFGGPNNGGPQFFTDIDVTFTMSGETDNGLTFGASVDLDEGGASAPIVTNPGGAPVPALALPGATQNNSDDGGATIFISGGFGTVTMGDTDGALDWALTEAGNVGNPGSLADDETSHAGYVGAYLDGANDGQILRWDYTSGAFGVAISLEDDNGSKAANTGVGYAIGFKYALDLSGTTVNFGLGHQKAADGAPGTPNDIKATGVSVDATFANGLSAGIVYADWSSVGAAGPDSNIGVGLGYTTGALSMHANYGEVKFNGGGKAKGFGLAAAYDLGGGAVVHFGYGSGKTSTAAPTGKSASLGLGLSF
ncbi:outer membrane protein OmpU [Litoreibacter halocynthiae]|uniref:Outer membrane protein OmpU n=1 Tax=Litoreibacter halocynthiae TaxID=1242689 RepID=A0A4R7LGG7_9RHOB|nr:porin [Litoreibacter halocynthiae]TDT73050.1 outer membrane protein OmpU [Litoreibacter halocynthiae]